MPIKKEGEIQEIKSNEMCGDPFDYIWIPAEWNRKVVLRNLPGRDLTLMAEQLPPVDRHYLFWEELLKKGAGLLVTIQGFRLYGIGEDEQIATAYGETISNPDAEHAGYCAFLK